MKENSIKEDIIILEQLIIANENCIKNAKNKDNPFVNVWKIQNIAIEHILSDYKRVLKENEELKQDKINNYRMIALAQNEALGYMQGYEDGKKLKTSAIASIVENQQYYIIKKQMEKYEEHIKRLQKENEELKNAVNVVNKEKADWIRAYQEEKDKQFELLRSNIPVQEVKDKIEELKEQYNVRELDFIKTTQDIRKIIIQSLEELIEGKN